VRNSEQTYYAARAHEYERIYHKPERQTELRHRCEVHGLSALLAAGIPLFGMASLIGMSEASCK
jgi:hypothetical protein